MGAFGGAFGTQGFGEATGETRTDPTLLFGYADLIAEVGEYLAVGRAPTDDDVITKVDRIVQEGLRVFYTPPAIEEGGKPHTWSFLRPVRHITLTGGFNAHELPSNYGGGAVRFIPVTGATKAPISLIGVESLMSLQAQGDAVDTPLYAAIRVKNTDSLNVQTHEVLFYPVPDADFTIQYQYQIMPDKIDAANSIPYGGSHHSQTILMACLAWAELRHTDKVRGDMHAAFMESLVRSIHLDKLLAPESVGTSFEFFSTLPTTLEADFNYLVTEIGGALGFGHDPGVYSHDETERVRRILDRGLRQFYYPPLLNGQFTAWKWSFLRPVKTLSVVADDGDYDLPSDVGSIDGSLTYANQTVYPPLKEVSENAIREHRQSLELAKGRPQFYAVRLKGGDGTAAQVLEILLAPTPDAVYTLSYKANVRPSRITASKPYPLSGPEDSEALLTSCLAVVEDDVRGPHYEKFIGLLAGAVKRDQARTVPDFLGRLVDRSGVDTGFDPRTVNTLSLNGTVIIPQ